MLRIETLPYPFNALREAVFNSLMHNDWSAGQPIQIKVYDHKLSILNRSILGLGWTVENHSSRHINPLVSNTFSKAGLVEKFGTGISKILDACEEEGNPVPQFRTSPDGFDFSVTLESSNLYLALEEYREQLDPKGGFVDYRKVISMMKVDKPSRNETGLIEIDTSLKQSDTGVNPSVMKRYQSTSDNCKRVYQLIKENPAISYSQLASKLSTSRSTVSRAISILKDNGYIQANDKNRSGEWEILKEYPN